MSNRTPFAVYIITSKYQRLYSKKWHSIFPIYFNLQVLLIFPLQGALGSPQGTHEKGDQASTTGGPGSESLQRLRQAGTAEGGRASEDFAQHDASENGDFINSIYKAMRRPNVLLYFCIVVKCACDQWFWYQFSLTPLYRYWLSRLLNNMDLSHILNPISIPLLSYQLLNLKKKTI